MAPTLKELKDAINLDCQPKSVDDVAYVSWKWLVNLKQMAEGWKDKNDNRTETKS